MLPLVWYEITRNLRPARALPLVGFCLILAYQEVSPNWSPPWVGLQGALTMHNDWLLKSIPLVAGIVGSSLSDEQRRGVTLTFLSRGVTRSQYLLSKILGSAASGALITAAAIGGFYILVAILWPWGPTTWDDGRGPVWALYTANRLASDLLGASMSIVAAAGMSVVSVLVGTLTSNRYIAMAAPLLLLIASVVLKETLLNDDPPFAFLNLSIQLDVFHAYGRRVPPLLRPYAAFVYWPCFAAMLAALGRWIFVRKELT